MSATVIRCDRCGRRCRRMGDWNATVKRGVVVGFLCPDCQTPEEKAEALVNEATTVYGRDAHWRFTGRPKADA